MAGNKRLFAMQLVKQSAALLDQIRRPVEGVVILLYHRVGAGSGLEVDLPAALFEEQMALLASQGRVVTLDAALDRLARPQLAVDTPAPVVLTFDDGTEDFAEIALPILERHRLPVTLYVATSFVEDRRPFPADGRPISWSALNDAVATGLVTVGSHTHEHILLDRVSAPTAQADIDRSIELIGAHLELVPNHFAYPKAVAPSTEVAGAVRRRFRSAALAGTRPNPYSATNPYRLARSPIQVADGMRWFQQKMAGGMVFEDRARTVLNRRRYAGQTT